MEELLAERSIRVSYVTVLGWMAKFGPWSASELREPEAPPGRTWHLDEMAACIGGKRVWLWRVVDEHGAMLDVLLQKHRDTDAVERFFRTLLGQADAAPERVNADKRAATPPHLVDCRSWSGWITSGSALQSDATIL